jgi:hypothetical protein
MSLDHPLVLALIGVIVLAVVIGAAARYFSPEARFERRRRKSNYRVVNKAKGPSVTLSVRTKKE